jgi:hypothetical protein
VDDRVGQTVDIAHIFLENRIQTSMSASLLSMRMDLRIWPGDDSEKYEESAIKTGQMIK